VHLLGRACPDEVKMATYLVAACVRVVHSCTIFLCCLDDPYRNQNLYIIGRFCLSVTFLFIPARLDFHGSRSVFMVFHGSRLVVHGSRSVFIVPG